GTEGTRRVSPDLVESAYDQVLLRVLCDIPGSALATIRSQGMTSYHRSLLSIVTCAIGAIPGPLAAAAPAEGALPAAGSASAQSYPSRPLRFVVPGLAGTSPD